MKGIILAGGTATRLYPITKAVCKQLLPVYDKPMIYYPLSVLLLAGIKDILIISTPEALPQFKSIFQDGSHLGIKISYAVQEKPRGLADAFIIGASFIAKDNVAMVLGDNIFFGPRLSEMLQRASQHKKGATVFGYYVKDPGRYGVIEFNGKAKVLSIEEKPKKPRSNWALTGLYFFDNQVVKIASNIKPSARGEIEITDVIKAYLRKEQLEVECLGRGYAWLDTGTHESLIDASIFVKTIEDRQGLKIACIEEIAYNMGFIEKKQLITLGRSIKSPYGEYLLKLVDVKK